MAPAGAPGSAARRPEREMPVLAMPGRLARWCPPGGFGSIALDALRADEPRRPPQRDAGWNTAGTLVPVAIAVIACIM